MATARCALILMALVTSGAPLRAQQAQDRADNGVALSPSDTPVVAPRPKPRKLLFDLLQTMVKAGEQSAPGPQQTVPIDPKGGSAPVPTDPFVVPPPVAVVTPKPRPVAIKADPVRPSAPRPLPREAALPPLPKPPAMEALPPPPAEPVEASPLLPPPITARADDPPVEERNAIAWLWLAVALVTALAGGGATHLRRVRRLARTRTALSLAPRIDFSGVSAVPPEFALTKPAVAIRARLEECVHG